MFLFHFEGGCWQSDFSMQLLWIPDLILDATEDFVYFFSSLTSATYSLYCLHGEGYFLVYTLGMFVTQYGSPFIFHLLSEMKTKLKMC